MGKRIIQQARGKGSLTYRVRKQAFNKKISHPKSEGEATITKILHSAAHSAPLMKLSINKESCYLPAFNGAFVEQTLKVGGTEIQPGNILKLKNIPEGTQVYNIERNPGDGGKMIRTSGSFATLTKQMENGKVKLVTPSKKELILHPQCRAVVGRIAGDGRLNKPFVTAGKKYYKMKAKSKLWPRVSAVAMNAVDHPFGSGRGKRVKSKIAKRNAPPGRKVGHIRPKRTGYKR